MYEIPLYEAEVEREGSDITIVATQIMLDKAHKAIRAAAGMDQVAMLLV